MNSTKGTPADAGVLAPRRRLLALALLGGCAAVVATVALTARADRSDAGDQTSPKATASVAAPTSANGFAAALQAEPDGTPAERRILTARKALDLDSSRPERWNDLALGLARRARETADTAYYKEAWTATERSLQLEPNNLEGRKLQVWILLGQHEFKRAADTAEQINRQTPDDVLTYGFMVDAYSELGRYAEAEKAAQWMLDMRPGNVPGLTRAAYLRELFGDHEGAVELMDTAYRRTAETETEDRAWILTQIAHLSLLTCRTTAAETLLNEALALFPDYHYALAQMADVRTGQGRLKEAADLRERHVRGAPHPENRFEHGVALARAGRHAAASVAWQEFETAARKELESWDNANIELIYYYADHVSRPLEALALARREAGRRQDVRTMEALAWALHKNGRSREGLVEMQKALAVGIRTAASFYHAGAIAKGAGDENAARQFLEQSSATCGTSPAAAEARALLE